MKCPLCGSWNIRLLHERTDIHFKCKKCCCYWRNDYTEFIRNTEDLIKSIYRQAVKYLKFNKTD